MVDYNGIVNADDIVFDVLRPCLYFKGLTELISQLIHSD